MRVVVTGGAGFIGSHVVERLAVSGHEAAALDDLSTGARDNVPPGVQLVELDVATTEAAKFIAATAPAAVVHCAAQASVARSVADPVGDVRSNIVGTLQVLRGAMEAGCSTFVYVTTGGAIYGAGTPMPANESSRVRPESPYGLSKWTAEEYLRLLAPENLSVAVLRLANVYGPRQRTDGEGGVVSIFLDRMLRNRQVEIHGDGEQTRDFVFVGDVVDAVEAAMAARRSLTVNIGTGVGTSVNSLFAIASEVTAYRIAPEHVVPRPGDVRHSRLDSRAAFEELGWAPGTDLEEGIRLTAAALGTTLDA